MASVQIRKNNKCTHLYRTHVHYKNNNTRFSRHFLIYLKLQNIEIETLTKGKYYKSLFSVLSKIAVLPGEIRAILNAVVPNDKSFTENRIQFEFE